jgi:hypothetical protein
MSQFVSWQPSRRSELLGSRHCIPSQQTDEIAERTMATELHLTRGERRKAGRELNSQLEVAQAVPRQATISRVGDIFAQWRMQSHQDFLSLGADTMRPHELCSFDGPKMQSGLIATSIAFI